MAQSNAEPSYRPEMDGEAHEQTYGGFTHFTVVGSVCVTCIVVALAVGGVKQGWLSALVMILLALITTGIGLVSTAIAWRAPAVVLGILLLMLLLY